MTTREEEPCTVCARPRALRERGHLKSLELKFCTKKTLPTACAPRTSERQSGCECDQRDHSDYIQREHIRMFLKNVPRVAAMHTEWRPFGPARTFRLPLCFGDANSSIPASDKPIPDEVQMIIDTLRSTQSALNMNDENSGTLQVGEAQAPGCNGKASYVVQKAMQTGVPDGNRLQKQKMEAMKVEPQSQDSDSDDSVDRGIEEAIQEYLKEKGDHKQSMKLNSSPLQMTKPLRRNLTSSEMSKYSDSNKIVTASNNVPKGLKASHSTAGDKKLVPKEKNEGSGLSFIDTDVSKAQMVKSPTDPTSHSDRVEHPVIVKEKEESSSDDGIEEAIWHFQLEKKKKHQDSRNPSKVFQAKEESDSSSDDGIEEAIRHYQLEKQKEKSENTSKAFKTSVPKHTQEVKAAVQGSSQSSTQANKKQKVPIKKRRTDKFPKSTFPPPVTVGYSFSTPLDNRDARGDEVSLNKNAGLLQLESPTPLKANTTAELMCAEAILDISKAVMPEAFPDTSSFLTTFIQPTSPPTMDCLNWSGQKSDESSVDSDDGIEQEIRKFLESKAQMHKQLPDTKYNSKRVDDLLKNNVEPSQNKKLKSSLSRKRKRKEENLKASKEDWVACKVKDSVAPVKCDSISSTQASGNFMEASVITDVTTTSSPGVEQNIDQKCSSDKKNKIKAPGTDGDLHLSQSENEVTESLSWEERQSGDKSSSLDSDEDLHQAIKDLLKTKRKVKKKSRDKKLKPRKRTNQGVSESSQECEAEKKKVLTENKSCTNPKTPTNRGSKNCKEMPKLATTDKSKVRKNIIKQIDPDKLEKTFDLLEPTVVPEGSVTNAPEMEEDSSSVDSDDSIEQEIRKFLAEKARESSVRTDFEEIRDNGVNTTDIVAKRTGVFEAQQAEVSSNTSTRYSDLLPSDESQPRCQEGDHLQSSSTDLYVPKINKSHQADGPRDANQCHSDQNACITPGSVTNSKLINQTTPRRETEVSYLQGQNLLPCSPFSPPREWEVGMTGKSDLHRVADRHQTKSVLPTDDVSPTMGDSATASRHKLSNPCAHSPEMALTASPPNPKFISAQLPDKHHKNQPAKDSCQGQPAASTMSENAVHERDSIKTSHIQVKNGNRSRGEDGTCVMGEMISRRIEEGLQVREGWEERADETDFESEERTSGSQQSEQRSQHPRL
ncbi:protein phosphatase 1 regulatory subunit 26-like [Arapaima gigas]